MVITWPIVVLVLAGLGASLWLLERFRPPRVAADLEGRIQALEDSVGRLELAAGLRRGR